MLYGIMGKKLQSVLSVPHIIYTALGLFLIPICFTEQYVKYYVERNTCYSLLAVLIENEI